MSAPQPTGEVSAGPSLAIRPASPAAPGPVATAALVLLLLALGYSLRAVLSPLVLFPAFVAVIWPYRAAPYAARLIAAAAALTLIWLLRATGSLLAPFVLGLAFAYVLAPVADLLERRRVPRAAAILLAVFPFLIAVGLLTYSLVPAVQRQLLDFVGRLPDLVARLAKWLESVRALLLSLGGGLLSAEQAERVREFRLPDLAQLVEQQQAQISRRVWVAVLGVGRGVGTALAVAAYVLITPVVTYYVLRDWRKLTRWLAELVPPARREATVSFFREYDRALGRYLRGALTEAALVGVLTGVLLRVFGFPSPLLIGVIAAFCNLVPYIGLPVSLIPALAIALASDAIIARVITVAGVFGVVQFIDGAITGPRIVGESVGLNPVWIMVALAFFGSLLGFVGLLVAVPLAVLIRLVVERALARYRSSEYYAAGR